MKLTDSEARKAIAVLIFQRRLRPTQVAAAVRAHDRMVSELRQRLAALESGKALDGSRRPRAEQKTQKRISVKRRAAMARQGKYLGAIRRLSVKDRGKVKAILASKGYSAAMQQARSLAK
jgi:uncharacterized protein YrrD